MKIEKLISLIFFSLATCGLIFLGIKFFTGNSSNDFLSVSTDLQQTYAKEISQETDVNKLVTQGVKLVKGNQLECGIVNFTRATAIEPHYRDAWVWLGYAQIKNGKSSDALKSLSKAAKIDPIHPDTFKYLAVAYTETGDAISAKKMQDRYDFLVKKK